MTLDEFLDSVDEHSTPPSGLSRELQAMWLIKKDEWEASHNIAQDIPTPMGSRIHGLLHTIEGDLGNAAYWYNRAGKPSIRPGDIDSEWEAIVESLIDTK